MQTSKIFFSKPMLTLLLWQIGILVPVEYCSASSDNVTTANAIQKLRASKQRSSGGQANTGASGRSTMVVSTPTPGQPSSSATAQVCLSENQKFLPFSYLHALVDQIQIVKDPGNQSFRLNLANMISNCSSMLKFDFAPAVRGFPHYLQVQIVGCSAPKNGKCSYNYQTIEGGRVVSKNNGEFEPSVHGYTQCLNESGALTDKAVKMPFSRTFKTKDQTAELVFLSQRPSDVDSVYGEIRNDLDDCRYTEKLSSEGEILYSREDQKKRELDERAAEVCKQDDYRSMTSFLETHQNYQTQMKDIRDRLIIRDLKKLVDDIKAKISKKEDLSELDFEVLRDYMKLVVEPLTLELDETYKRLSEIKDNPAEQRKLTSELDKMKRALADQAKNFPEDIVKKLKENGLFSDALRGDSLHIISKTYQKLGNRISNELFTPAVVADEIKSQIKIAAEKIEQEKKEYGLKTGQITGESDALLEEAALIREEMESIRESRQREMQELITTLQRCRTQGCIQQTQEELADCREALIEELKELNEVANELEAKAKKYAEMEKQGEAYLAKKYGKEDAERTRGWRDRLAEKRQERARRRVSGSRDSAPAGVDPAVYQQFTQQQLQPGQPAFPWGGNQSQFQTNPFMSTNPGGQWNPNQWNNQWSWNQRQWNSPMHNSPWMGTPGFNGSYDPWMVGRGQFQPYNGGLQMGWNAGVGFQVPGARFNMNYPMYRP